jgi:hypothetical protein
MYGTREQEEFEVNGYLLRGSIGNSPVMMAVPSETPPTFGEIRGDR